MSTQDPTTKPATSDPVNRDNGGSLDSNTEKFGQGALDNDLRPGSAQHLEEVRGTTQETDKGGSTAIDLEVERLRSSEGKKHAKQGDDK